MIQYHGKGDTRESLKSIRLSENSWGSLAGHAWAVASLCLGILGTMINNFKQEHSVVVASKRRWGNSRPYSLFLLHERWLFFIHSFLPLLGYEASPSGFQATANAEQNKEVVWKPRELESIKRKKNFHLFSPKQSSSTFLQQNSKAKMKL